MKKIAAIIISCIMGLSATYAKTTTDIKLTKVANNIYAIVGPLGNRTKANMGSNATFGFVVTQQGVVLIDPGATWEGAARIHQLIKSVTKQPVKIVINSGVQDHRWLGNEYFKKQGASIIASKDAVKGQQEGLQDQYFRLGSLIGEKNLKKTNPVYADKTFEKEYDFVIGGVTFRIVHAGTAHTSGDSFVWLPEQQVVFTGDIVYTQRMLGVSAHSNSRSWIKVFEKMASFKPKYVVPGHGVVTTLAVAKKDTYDYLVFLRKLLKEYIEAGGGIENVGKLDQNKFSYLKNFKSLRGRNAQQVFQELEFE